MTIVYIFAGLLLLSVLIAWYSYRTAFYSPKKRKEDDYAIPKGAQYEKERQRMLSLIRQMDDIPYETVSDIVIRHKPFGREVFVGMTLLNQQQILVPLCLRLLVVSEASFAM